MASSRSSCLLNSAIHLSVGDAQPEFLAAGQLRDALQYSAVLVTSHGVAPGQDAERRKCIEASAVRREQCAGPLEPMLDAAHQSVTAAIEALYDMPRRDAQRAGQALPHDATLREYFGAIRGCGLGRRRWGRRPKVRDEVTQRHIRFMPHGGDHRHRHCSDRARDALTVEGPEILD